MGDAAPSSTYLNNVRRSSIAWLGGLLVSSLGLLAACNALFGVDVLSYEPATGVGQGGSGASGQGGTTSGSRNLGGGGGQASGGQGGSGGLLQPAGGVLWSRRFGGSSKDVGESVAVDEGGNIVIAGTFEGSVDFGTGTLTSIGGLDIFLLKLNAQGETVWSKSFGGTKDEDVASVAIDQQGNIALAGDFRQSIDFGGGALQGELLSTTFAAIFSPTGAHQYSAAFGNKAFFDLTTARDIDVAADHFVMAGGFGGSVDFGGGKIYASQIDLFVAKLSASGSHQWSDDYGGENTQIAEAVALDSAANVLLTGQYRNSMKFDDDKLNSQGDYDIFVAKLDPAGQPSWALSFGDKERQQGLAIAVDAADNVIVGGNLQGSVDFGGGPLVTSDENEGLIDDVFVLKLDSSGKHVFSARYGDDEDQDLRGLAVDLNDNLLLTGELKGKADFGGVDLLVSTGGEDIYIVKLGPDGQHLWSYAFGGVGDQYARDIAATPLGKTVVTGSFEASLDFGGTTTELTSQGQDDVFVVKLQY